MLQQQVQHDIANFERYTGSRLSPTRTEELQRALRDSKRWTFILSGVTHPRFEERLPEPIRRSMPLPTDLRIRLAAVRCGEVDRLFRWKRKFETGFARRVERAEAAERLVAAGVELVRVGHPARVSPGWSPTSTATCR